MADRRGRVDAPGRGSCASVPRTLDPCPGCASTRRRPARVEAADPRARASPRGDRGDDDRTAALASRASAGPRWNWTARRRVAAGPVAGCRGGSRGDGTEPPSGGADADQPLHRRRPDDASCCSSQRPRAVSRPRSPATARGRARSTSSPCGRPERRLDGGGARAASPLGDPPAVRLDRRVIIGPEPSGPRLVVIAGPQVAPPGLRAATIAP